MKKFKVILIMLCCLQVSNYLKAQQPNAPSAKPSTTESTPNKKKAKLNRAAQSLEESLEKNDEVQQADNYLNVGNELLKQDMPAKAEPYFQKAEQIYKQNNVPQGAATSSYNLGVAQEEQNKKAAAAASYKRAASMSSNADLNNANREDAIVIPRDRASDVNPATVITQDAIHSASDRTIITPSDRKEIVRNAVANPTKAADSISQALKNNRINEVTVVKTARAATKLLLEKNRIKEAILFNEKLLHSLQSAHDKEAIVAQLILLGSLYHQNNESPLTLYQNAYHTATSIPSVPSSREAVKALLNYYYQSGDTQQAKKLTEDFLSKIDSIIANDSQYDDLKKFEKSEKRIAQLEREKSLQDATIRQSKFINNILIGSIIGALAFLGFVIYTNRNINIKNKRIALQSLRREMNPHFIFNSLNSINEYIISNDERKANTFLTSYATLMRRVMDNNNEDFVPLTVEVDLLRKYIALEHLRFSDKFDYEINVQEGLMKDEYHLPNMVIQPFLENAIWHGLRYRKDKGILTLNIEKLQEKIVVSIEDNGIGIHASKSLKTKHQKDFKSLGMSNTQDRITLINSLYHTKITTDVQSDDAGTCVIITIPLR